MAETQSEDTPLYERLITVSAFIMPYEADIVRSLLESEAIPVFLMDYHTIYIKWFYSIALGGIKVQVHEKDFELAKEIIGNALLEGQSQALQFSEGICPNCTSIKTSPVVLGRRWAILTWLFVGVPLIWPWIRLRCSDCKNTWRDPNHQSVDNDEKPN